MTSTLVIMAVVGCIASTVAIWQRRVHRPAPTSTRGEPPTRLARSDFRAPAAPWLIVVFTSSTCSSCEAAWGELSAYESATVATQNVDAISDADLHRRYGIDSVPTSVLADAAGLAKLAIVGPLGPREREALQAIIDGDEAR